MDPEVPLKKRKVDDVGAALTPVSGLLIKRHSEKAKLPTRGSPLAAGYDLYRYRP
jgi:dUTP pyrophosphatase